MVRVGMVAGEASGDLLGAELIESLLELDNSIVFEGIAGPRMRELGCETFVPAEKLSVMGLTEVLVHYRALKSIQSDLIKKFKADPPDIFIGIDAPDFNLSIEYELKLVGVKTIHYVSPSVWAWREYRLKKIKRAVDLMLTLFPFESDYYKKNGTPVAYVGHPLAKKIPKNALSSESRVKLALPNDKKIVAILPGSRDAEINALAEEFIKTASWCANQRADLFFVVPAINEKCIQKLAVLVKKHAPELPIRYFNGNSHEVMSAADVVLIACGTATLEAMLLKKPMVVAYRVSSLSYFLLKYFVKTPFFSLPNLLAGKRLVSEYIQNEINYQRMGKTLLNYLSDEGEVVFLKKEFDKIHDRMNEDIDSSAAECVIDLVRKNRH